MWILLVLLYGIFKGGREICKKKAMESSSPLEVLVMYTLISFVLVVPDVKNAFGFAPRFLIFIAIKSFSIFVAWLCSFYAIKKLPISLYGVLDLSRVLFSTLLGVTVLGEVMGIFQIAGLVLVCAGLLSLKVWPKKKAKKVEDENLNVVVLPQIHSPIQTTSFYVLLAFISCALNAVSGLFDKILMKDLNSSQLQFWYMLFLVCFYAIFIICTRQKIRIIQTVKNKWIWILSILFVIADRAFFIANGMDGSKITVMTLIKQSGCIVTILAGRFIFKEQHTFRKLFSASIIILGIVLGVIGR